MLVRVEQGAVLAIGQLSHAWMSGQIARAWGNERFGALEPLEEVALGAEQHDVGWAAFDLHPRVSSATGLPRSFTETTVAEHLKIWRGAPERLLSQSLRAALVVSLHGRTLSERRLGTARAGAPRLREHIAEERARQRSLRAQLDVSAEEAERLRRLIWAWDGLSLALCNGWEPFTSRDVPAADGVSDLELGRRRGGLFTLDPWPFASARVELRCEARRLRPRYADDAALRRDFERAEPVTLRFSLVPARPRRRSSRAELAPRSRSRARGPADAPPGDPPG
jgi:hypothetical protein